MTIYNLLRISPSLSRKITISTATAAAAALTAHIYLQPTSAPIPALTSPMSPSSSPSSPKTFHDGLPLPKVLIFDLDYTLWPLWIDTHVSGPLRPSPQSTTSNCTTLLDASSSPISFYPSIHSLIPLCRHKSIALALASRTHAPSLARKALSLLTLDDRPAVESFDALEIYPGDKVRHMDEISKKLGVGYEEMVFFDDEERNGNVERKRGVCFWLVGGEGVTAQEVDGGVGRWRERRRRASKG